MDLLLETPAGAIGMEIKHRLTAVSADSRGLLTVAAALGGRSRGGLVVTSGGQLEPLVADRSIWTVPVHRLVDPETPSRVSAQTLHERFACPS